MSAHANAKCNRWKQSNKRFCGIWERFVRPQVDQVRPCALRCQYSCPSASSVLSRTRRLRGGRVGVGQELVGAANSWWESVCLLSASDVDVGDVEALELRALDVCQLREAVEVLVAWEWRGADEWRVDIDVLHLPLRWIWYCCGCSPILKIRSTTSMPDTTSPKGEKPMPSSRLLSPKLINLHTCKQQPSEYWVCLLLKEGKSIV